MHKKLAKLNEQQLIDLIEDIFEDMKENNMTAIYNKYMDKVNEIAYHITENKAKDIVRHMQPYSEMFSMEMVRNMLTANNIPYEDNACVKYYLCMNMYANDAKQVAEENNMPLEKFCFIMAKTFINDIDGGKFKVEKYFMEVLPE